LSLDANHGFTPTHSNESKEIKSSEQQSSNSGASEFTRSMSNAMNKVGEAVHSFFQALNTYCQTTQVRFQI